MGGSHARVPWRRIPRLGFRAFSTWRSLLGSKGAAAEGGGAGFGLQRRLSRAEPLEAVRLFERFGDSFDTVHLLTALRVLALAPDAEVRRTPAWGRMLDRAKGERRLRGCR
ncbi:unnamed protein product [Effrenium voratum]|nr:unnamed protein product [Effrenium voratum]